MRFSTSQWTAPCFQHPTLKYTRCSDGPPAESSHPALNSFDSQNVQFLRKRGNLNINALQ